MFVRRHRCRTADRGVDTGLGLLDRHTGEVEWLGDVEPDRPETRCNDGRPDRNGSFVFGTMVETPAAEGEPDPAPGNFYHWNAGRGLTHLYRNARIANGLCFGADGLIIHYADSVKGTLWRARYHPQHALLIEDEVFIAANTHPGAPDGAAVDTDGNVWNARWGASGVACFAPDGTMVAFVDLDVPHVSACAFGGPDLDRLYITTAREHLSPDDPVYERSGSLYVADVGATGLAPVPVVTGRA
ncbi:MAG: SMP-30/gluconolactonase/LRE family protein [Acidimicrobiales bacterium]